MYIRKNKDEDREMLERLYSLVFPDEDLLPLLHGLLDEKDKVLSLVAVSNDIRVKGHAMFTLCEVSGSSDRIVLLGPVAVYPDIQKQGVGTALIQDGMRFMADDGVSGVCVLGDSLYYGRFGFDACYHIMPPYEIPQEWSSAWQFISLNDIEMHSRGKLCVPDPWRNPALWSS